MIIKELTKQQITNYLPHQGNMCLIEQVQTWNDSTIHCLLTSHQQLDNPLRTNNCLSTIHVIEYAAQAAALHLALQHTTEIPKIHYGYLAAVQKCFMAVQRLDNIEKSLQLICSQLFLEEHKGAFYEFKLYTEEPLASGQFLIMIIDKKDKT